MCFGLGSDEVREAAVQSVTGGGGGWRRRAAEEFLLLSHWRERGKGKEKVRSPDEREDGRFASLRGGSFL